MPEFFWQSQESLGGRALRLPLDLLEWPYRLGAALHRGYYRLRPGARVELPAAVVDAPLDRHLVADEGGHHRVDLGARDDLALYAQRHEAQV